MELLTITLAIYQSHSLMFFGCNMSLYLVCYFAISITWDFCDCIYIKMLPSLLKSRSFNLHKLPVDYQWSNQSRSYFQFHSRSIKISGTNLVGVMPSANNIVGQMFSVDEPFCTLYYMGLYAPLKIIKVTFCKSTYISVILIFHIHIIYIFMSGYVNRVW